MDIQSFNDFVLHDQCFITGCDKNTEWMLPWFVEKYHKHVSVPLVFADFGCTPQAITLMEGYASTILEMSHLGLDGWFKKPQTILEVSRLSLECCWIDTDFEILGDMGKVFDFIEPNKLNMVEDKPWSKRRGEEWHNSGIVGVKGTPEILNRWSEATYKNPQIGDQEILHSILKTPLDRVIYINTLPNEFNWLRIQLLDGQDSNKKLAIHWTGRKGKMEIKKQMEKSQNE